MNSKLKNLLRKLEGLDRPKTDSDLERLKKRIEHHISYLDVDARGGLIIIKTHQNIAESQLNVVLAGQGPGRPNSHHNHCHDKNSTHDTFYPHDLLLPVFDVSDQPCSVPDRDLSTM